MGDVSAEPSMEDILSSIKRIIAEEGDAATAPPRVRRPRPPIAERLAAARDEEVLELNERLDVTLPEEEEVVPAETILSSRAAEASRGSLESLSKLVKPEPAGGSAGVGGDSFEGVIREMLRPMLRDWLDANLPAMVETMVAREISRITGSAG